MITKKLNQEIFAWDPNAFGGKGYWFILGAKGGFGRAASKKEAGTLGRPQEAEVQPAAPEVYDTAPAKEPTKQVPTLTDVYDEEKPKKGMSYREASRIRKRGLLSSIMEKKFEEQKGLGTSIRESISDKTKATFKGIQEKFDPLNMVRALTGDGAIGKSIRTVAGRAMGRSDESIGYFGGYERDKKKRKKGTAELISSTTSATPPTALKGDEDAASIVMKIYDLMKQSYDDKKKLDEKGNTKGPGKVGGTFVPTKNESGEPSAEKVQPAQDDKTSLVDKILNIFNLGKTALSVLTSLGPLLINPITLALLGAVVAGSALKWLWDNSDKEETKKSLAGQGAGGVTAAGLGSESQMATPTADEESRKKMSSGFDKKGLKGASLQELEAKKAEILDVGVDPRIKQKKGMKLDAVDNKRLQLIEQIDAEISSRKQTASPAAGDTASPSAPASGGGGEGSSGGAGGGGSSSASPVSSASPMPSAPATGDRLDSATKSNEEVQAQSQQTPTQPVVMNTTNNSSTPGKTDSTTIGSQAVRDDEESSRRIKIQSVRKV